MTLIECLMKPLKKLKKIKKIMKKMLDKRLKVCYNKENEIREVIQMEMLIYVNGYPMGGAISGCEYIGEAWVKAQELAEMLDVSCALVSAETGEVIAWWEP